MSSDDKRIPSMGSLLGISTIVTEKLDGSNICMTQDAFYARSHNGPPNHPSFNWIKGFFAAVRTCIPSGWSLFAEYTYAVHSVRYEQLPHCVFLFGIRDDEKKLWEPWTTVVQTAKLIDVPTVPVLLQHTFHSEVEMETYFLLEAAKPSVFGGPREGMVVRNAEGFSDADFRVNVAKHVREGHVQTDVHWMRKQVERQNIASEVIG